MSRAARQRAVWGPWKSYTNPDGTRTSYRMRVRVPVKPTKTIPPKAPPHD